MSNSIVIPRPTHAAAGPCCAPVLGWCALLAAAALGCSQAEDAPSSGAATAPAQTMAALFACDEAGFSEGRPLVGSGFDRTRGGVLGDPAGSFVVHATQAYWKPGRRDDFVTMVQRVGTQLDGAPGVLAYALGVDEKCGVGRTLGIWASEAALYDAIGSGAHAEAMRRSGELTLTGKTTHWSATAAELLELDWDAGRRQLERVQPYSNP